MNTLRDKLEEMEYDDLVQLRIALADDLMSRKKSKEPTALKLFNESLPIGALHKDELNEDDLMGVITSIITVIVVTGKRGE